MFIRLLTVIAVLCLATAAQAQNVWSAPGTACVPDHTATGLYQADASSVRHSGTNVGTIAFNCQMDRFNNGTTGWNLKLMYRDSTGTATTGAVLARIYRMPIGSATPVQLVLVNSNSSAVTANNYLASAQFTHTFDFEANTYWARVVLSRTASSQIVIFHALVLDGTSF